MRYWVAVSTFPPLWSSPTRILLYVLLSWFCLMSSHHDLSLCLPTMTSPYDLSSWLCLVSFYHNLTAFAHVSFLLYTDSHVNRPNPAPTYSSIVWLLTAALPPFSSIFLRTSLQTIHQSLWGVSVKTPGATIPSAQRVTLNKRLQPLMSHLSSERHFH